jgi:hypothetical protein
MHLISAAALFRHSLMIACQPGEILFSGFGKSEDAVEEAPTETFEQTEHAEHATHSGSNFISMVALSIAVLAVLSAGIGSLESIEGAAALAAKTNSVLYQNKATDNWNFFQAKSLKKNMYSIAAAQGGSKAADFEAQARQNEADGAEIQKTAQDFEARSEQALKDGEFHEQRSQRLTVAGTFLHIAIAIATIAIITSGRRWPWYASLALGGLGILLAGGTYLVKM